MFRIVLSGPIHGAARVVEDLEQAGFMVARDPAGEPDAHDHGFPGEAVGVPVRFLTVEGGGVDRAAELAGAVGWCLRAHWPKPEPRRVPTVAERLAAIGLTLGDIREALA